MMRYILLNLVGLSLALPGFAQNLLENPSGGETPLISPDETSPMNIGIQQIKESERERTQTVNIFTNRFQEPSAPDEADVTNVVKQSKVGFLISTGVEYADEGEYVEAEKAYLRALEVDPENEGILFRLGTLYINMERFKDAVRIFKGLTERYPDNPLSHNNLAWCYATGPGVKNKTLALRHAREAILSGPREPSIWNTLAEAYYMAGDYEKALRSSEFALELLQAANLAEEKQESFLMQREKILRAREALKLLEGLDEEE